MDIFGLELIMIINRFALSRTGVAFVAANAPRVQNRPKMPPVRAKN